MTPGPHEMAMFPLGSVLLPGARLPLRVFEPRYLQLLDSLDDRAPAFGVTLIERGPEVGGGDVRSSVGCRAEVIERVDSPDGDVFVSVIGRERVRVTRWLADDPFPRAVVEEFADPPARPDDPVHEQLMAAYENLIELAGGPAVIDAEAMPSPGDDPTERALRMAATLPLGPLDAFEVLAAGSPEDRARRLLDAIEGFELIIRSRPEE